MEDRKKNQPAYKSARAWTIFLSIAVLAAAADLWSKHAVFSWLLNDNSQQLSNKAANDAAYLKECHSAELPPADSEAFSRVVLQRLHIHRDVCRGLRFTLSTNPGVVFGYRGMPRYVVNIFTVAMMLAVCMFFSFCSRRDYWLITAFALILGGAAGNLYDRLFSVVSISPLVPIRFHVRDFIDCSDIGYQWVFNVADAWLVIGVAMVLLNSLWLWRKEMRNKNAGVAAK
ncbi:MAG TPA: signal peptidase II [Phycisphaerae bacterium]|nr:signal peptidase II [Phycisphaerae bacterium]HPS51934.1 signal peptidase II [Phycisphaerae bacterium]